MAMATTSVALAEDAPAAPASPHHFTANVGVYSNYVFRGLTQTGENPAVQGGFDYSHDSGIYVGTWASNISWFSDLNPGTSVSMEWDGYAGFKKTWAGALTTDIGYLRYEYLGRYAALPSGILKPDTDEVYLALGWKWSTLKYSYAVSDLFGVTDSKGSSYLDLSVAIPIKALTVSLHAGQQKYVGASGLNDTLFGYEDYKAGVSYGFAGGWSAGVTYTHTNAEDAGYTIMGKNIGDDQFIASISRSM